MLEQGRWLYLYFNHWQTTLVSVSECLIVLFAMMMTYSIQLHTWQFFMTFFFGLVSPWLSKLKWPPATGSKVHIEGRLMFLCELTWPHPLKMLFVFVFVGWILRKQLDFRLVSYYSLYTNVGTITVNNDNHDDDGLMMAVILLVIWILLNKCVNIEYTYVYEFISYTHDIICARV